MKLTINSRVLKAALESANRAVNPKASTPILANFHISCGNGYLVVTGTDTNNTIVETVPCEGEGTAVLPLNLLELVRALPDGEVSIATDATSATINWANGHSSIPCFEDKDYPTIASIPDTAPIVVKAQDFAKTAGRAIPFVADDQLRPVLGGVLFRTNGDHIDIVATDTRSLAIFPLKAEGDIDAVIPVGAIKSALGGNSDIEIYTAKDNICFRTGTTTVIARSIIGKFPNYESVVPKTFTSHLKADKASFKDAIHRVGVCSSKATGHIKLNLGVFESTIEAQDLAMGTTAKERPLGLTYDSADFSVGFKDDNLVKAISVFDGEVTIGFNDPKKATLVSSENDDAVIVVMPVAI